MPMLCPPRGCDSSVSLRSVFPPKTIFCALVWTALWSGPARSQQKCPAPPAITVPASTNIFNSQQELMLGDIEAERMERYVRIIYDEKLTERMNEVMNKILAQLPPTQLKFRVILIDSPNINAFSFGAGRIYVTRKMVAFLRNDDELAALLAHEMGHILSHQNAILVTREFHDILGVDSVTDKKDIADKYNRLEDNFARDRGLAQKIVQRMEKEEEPNQYMADRVGIYAVASAGYSTQGFLDLFDRLAQTHGKTGSGLSDFLGLIKPNEKRLREMHNSLASLPTECRSTTTATATPDFLAWQSEVIAHVGSGRKEKVVGVVSKKKLDPPLQTDILNAKFSPNGQYSLAQDDSSVYVFSNDPFEFLFRISSPESYFANFSPDSKKIRFLTAGLQVQEWSVEDEERSEVHDVTIPDGCIHTALSHDGKTMACVNAHLDLVLVDVGNSTPLLTQKEAFLPDGFGNVYDVLRWRLTLWAALGHGEWIQMGFSADDQYFAATGGGRAWSINVAGHANIPLRGDLKDLLKGHFAFLSDGRLLVQNGADPKNSAIMDFSTGKVIARIPISPMQNMRAPTKGNYVILSPVKDAKVGLLDLATQRFVIGSAQSPVMDVYDNNVLMQRKSGEVGIFDFMNHSKKGEVELPVSTLGRVQTWAISPDFKMLAISGTSRGSVWNLDTSKQLYFLRAFNGVYFDGDKQLFADFPKQDPQGRSIARVDLTQQNIVPGRSIDEKDVIHQYGPYLLHRKPDKENNLRRNVTWDVEDVRDGHVLWSRSFPKEVPTLMSIHGQSTVLLWNVDTDAAKDEIKNNGLQAKLAALQSQKGAYLLEVVESATGKPRGYLLVDTGNGSFQVSKAGADGDWVLVVDKGNRTHVYSLSAGEQKAVLFGSIALLSPAAGLLAVENETGQLDVYDLKSLEKKNELTFPYPISAWSFSEDGKRLFLLTGDQMVYVFDAAELGKAEEPKQEAKKD
jgi:WD40 repeat protein